MKELIQKKIKQYTSGDALPMHMPGHKRRVDAFGWLGELGAEMDITEIAGFDNLNDAKDIFRHSEERAASLWGAKRSFYLVNGSTGGILASVRAALLPGGEALVARNCHKSVYHALELCGNRLHFLLPEWDDSFGIFGSVRPETVEESLKKYPQVRLVILTSPTYEGVCSDLASIARICHRHGAALLVDAAHGAHLGLTEGEPSGIAGADPWVKFPAGAVTSGADLVVQSLHKTLPSLTQTAIVHWNSELVPVQELTRQIAIFQSSSPSYLLAAGMDGCVDYLETEGYAAMGRWQAALQEFQGMVRNLQVLRVLCYGEDSPAAHSFFAFDPSKLVISVRGTSHTGEELMAALREEYRIELEMSAADYALAMTGMGDTSETLTRLAEAVRALDRRWVAEAVPSVDAECLEKSRISEKTGFRHYVPEAACTIQQAVCSEKRAVSLPAAAGSVSAEYIWAYPPGIPLILPGEILTGELLEYIAWLQSQGVELHSTWDGLPGSVFVCD